MPFLFIFKKPFSNPASPRRRQNSFQLFFAFARTAIKLATDTTEDRGGECKVDSIPARALEVRLEKWNEMALSEKGNENRRERWLWKRVLRQMKPLSAVCYHCAIIFIKWQLPATATCANDCASDLECASPRYFPRTK